MDALFLSRFQFGLTAFFHFFFPPISIGLAAILTIMEGMYWRTGKEVYDRMARFWFKLFTIIFVAGVATGITMEFQFGTNWSEYSKFVGDIFGAPLAAEGVFAFFLESTFLGLLVFGRDRIGRHMRFAATFLVTLGATLSAFWIIVANSWQQTPTGYKIEGGRAVLTDFFGAVFNPSTIPRYLHTVDAAYITGAFFVMGISAYFLLKKKNLEIAKPSMKISVVFVLAALLLQGILGDIHAKQVAHTQPAKLAAFEGAWETRSNAPLNLIGFPNAAEEKTSLAIGIPGLLSWLAEGDTGAEIKGLKEFKAEERPPVALTYWMYRAMIFGAGWLTLMGLWGGWLAWRGRLYNHTLFLKLTLFSMFVPMMVNMFGWMAAEIGRQPWAVYGLLKTADGTSPLPAYQILMSIILFTVVYSLLAAGVIHLIRKEIRTAMGQAEAFGSVKSPDMALNAEV